jgi:hypothetical protein
VSLNLILVMLVGSIVLTVIEHLLGINPNVGRYGMLGGIVFKVACFFQGMLIFRYIK